MVVLIFVIISSLLVSYTDSKRPSTTLSVECGDPVKNTPAVITYVGDAVAVIGYGALPPPCRFKEDISTASFKLKAYYRATSGCKFVQTSVNRAIYGLKVESRLLHELFEGADDEKFIIECSFMRYKSNVSVDVPLIEKYKPAEMIVVPRGIVAESDFEIYMMSAVGGFRLRSAIQVHSLVKLQTRITRKNKEVGYMPLECLVESTDGKIKILVLASGCGTGFPWKKNQGFQMNGIYGDSPKFRMFRISKQQGIIFRCSFVVCQGSCNGSSCAAASKTRRRRRRSVDGLQYNSLGLLSDGSSGVLRSDLAVKIPDEEETDLLEMEKIPVYVAVLFVTGIVLIAVVVITVSVVTTRKRTNPR
ncbi:vitelline envelope sperm lysin receptor [Patella vulgata]|uniref:vitelline envelope sperm lysin receptor n=1 Tax=Patella vulgata TaxID=6465 RepID=UPI0021804CFC|nr:vitelline envelope sperm lysin receptor [Patella vulgata]XP_055958390.1 vitelline envelope sperm lysin receptor [Patella vulgata]